METVEGKVWARLGIQVGRGDGELLKRSVELDDTH